MLDRIEMSVGLSNSQTRNKFLELEPKLKPFTVPGQYSSLLYQVRVQYSTVNNINTVVSALNF